MKREKRHLIPVLALLLLLMNTYAAKATIILQCPGDINGDGISEDPNIVCMYRAAGDGFSNMADGRLLYTFGFSEIPPGLPANQVMSNGMLKAEMPAPTITVKEGQELYLNLVNVGMVLRPDLFDAHTIHFHGFINAAPFYDGEPMASFGTNMGASFTFYYKVLDPGTYMYHCHMEATEHMQMGMLGNLYITPAQDGATFEYPSGSGKFYSTFAYNDGDGSTGYDVAYPIQIHAFDPVFHDDDLNVQPPNFARLDDKYGMLNGRGYPDTINPSTIANSYDGNPSQKISSLITATSGQRILLRISDLSFDYYTLTVLGIPMQVVGKDAKLLRGPTGLNLYYNTNSVNIGGGESMDVILDTTGIAPGRYFLYTTNLNYLSNDGQERGGMMTEIVIN